MHEDLILTAYDAHTSAVIAAVAVIAGFTGPWMHFPAKLVYRNHSHLPHIHK